jgi:putative ABC transport system ATP-binding protein
VWCREADFGSSGQHIIKSYGGEVMASIVSAKNVHKTYDTGKIQVKALRGVDIEIEKGEMVAVMGPSGCGKTTLLNCLSGLDELTEGQVLIEGQDVHAMKDNLRTEYRAKKMGFIFQTFNLLPVLTAAENVELPLLVSGMHLKEARQKAEKALELVDLVEWKQHKPSELSGGQRQRVTIARSLVNQPTIVWGDEPTGNLDTENSNDVVDLLIRLNEENKQTFVLITHDPSVGKRCQRVIEMRSGLITKRYQNQ